MQTLTRIQVRYEKFVECFKGLYANLPYNLRSVFLFVPPNKLFNFYFLLITEKWLNTNIPLKNLVNYNQT